MLKNVKFGKKLLVLVLLACVLLSGCQKDEPANNQPKGKTYFNYFDTVSYIFDYRGDDNELFDSLCDGVVDILYDYHQLFDIYNEYDGVNNLCTINKNAGGQPLVCDERLIDFLLYAKQLYTNTKGEMNVMLGSVLHLWHLARETSINDKEKAYIPSDEELQTASLHTSIDLLEIDKENNTVRITDPLASIDVGALGKGYATEVAAQYLFDQKAYGYVLNIGGNIRIIGTKPDGSSWSTGIKNPNDVDSFAIRISIANIACVTSGNYERYFVYNGERYPHIIDKDTLYPAREFASITILTEDSGLADGLSTALFCMSYQDGLELIQSLDQKVDVLWIYQDGTMVYTTGFEDLIIK